MHAALVFLSCGQRDDEKAYANEIEQMIKNELHMDCYNADSVHGFDDVMSITDKLSVADYYVMIDFKRSDVVPFSVFTHQEFALARAWKLNKMLAFQEEGLDSYGMLSYVLAHPVPFTRDKLIATVWDEIQKQKWDNNYSRNLVASELEGPISLPLYTDQTGQYRECFWQLTIRNHRQDRAAVNTIAILDSIKNCTTGEKFDSPDRSYLKWVHQYLGYEHTILPEGYAAFDAFSIHFDREGLFLSQPS